jgi:hypothetical protein
MKTEKKNQHYIPKFYLRNFSFQKNQNQIGIYNLNNKFFHQTSKLKTQGSRNFFYGYNGIIEDLLADIEGYLSTAIKKVIFSQKLPPKSTKEHVDLLFFIILTDARNPVQIDNMKTMMSQMKERLVEINPETDLKKTVPELTHDEIIEMAITGIPETLFYVMDLDFKILKNETNFPFITSDFPVVKYNQFLESKKWFQSKSGYSASGLQIFLPLNSELVLHFFDSAIYKVGNKKEKIVSIKSEKEIHKINELQFVNCLGTIFFDENATEDYIRFLHEKASKFKRANEPKSKLSYIFDKDEDAKKVMETEKQNLIIFNTSDCETKFSIDCIKTHSKGKVTKLNPTMAQTRKLPTELLRLRHNSR